MDETEVLAEAAAASVEEIVGANEAEMDADWEERDGMTAEADNDVGMDADREDRVGRIAGVDDGMDADDGEASTDGV